MQESRALSKNHAGKLARIDMTLNFNLAMSLEFRRPVSSRAARRSINEFVAFLEGTCRGQEDRPMPTVDPRFVAAARKRGSGSSTLWDLVVQLPSRFVVSLAVHVNELWPLFAPGGKAIVESASRRRKIARSVFQKPAAAEDMIVYPPAFNVLLNEVAAAAHDVTLN